MTVVFGQAPTGPTGRATGDGDGSAVSVAGVAFPFRARLVDPEGPSWR